MNAASIDRALNIAHANAAAGSTDLDESHIVAGLSKCTLARIAYDVIAQLAEEAPWSYAWAMRWVAGKLSAWRKERCP